MNKKLKVSLTIAIVAILTVVVISLARPATETKSDYPSVESVECLELNLTPDGYENEELVNNCLNSIND